MAVADERREGCDGCGRTVAIEDLTAVTMPDGERIACCPQCEPHARAAARRPASAQRPASDADSRPASDDDGRLACDGCNERFPAAELDDLELPDGTVISCCPECLDEVPGAGDDTSGDGDASSADTASANAPSSSDDEPTSTETSGDDSETTELATTRNRCSQCHDVVTVECFSVTTIDGRSEEMCPTCKTIAEDKGVIKSVEMRKSEARDVLGVDADASQKEIRDAFHAQVKNAHPDRKTGSRSAFKLVKEAYERLR